MVQTSQTVQPAQTKITKYEKTKVIGMRLEQIARGAVPMVDVEAGMSVRDIVLKEYAECKIPFMVERSMPNGKKETIHLHVTS